MLHYKICSANKSAPWVTFIHGAGGSSAIWYKQIKDFRKHFNLLLIDLRGHGKSKKGIWKKKDSFREIAKEVMDVLDHLKIKSSHFIGISLGTIVIQTIAQVTPNRIQSMILGGAVIKLGLRTNFLLTLGKLGRFIIPYMLLYRLFAWIIMPRSTHLESRNAFVEQARRMCQKEFIRWFNLTRAINPFLKKLQYNFSGIPTLFLMGDEDYLFLPPVQQLVNENEELQLVCVPNSGHVCNIDQPEFFNNQAIYFINKVNVVLKTIV